MRTCPYCGNSVSDTANFCQTCGEDLRRIPAEQPPERIEYEQDDYTEEEQYSRENRKTVAVGAVLASLICVVGIGLWVIVSNMLKQESSVDVGSGLNNKTVQVTQVPETEPTEPADEQEQTEETETELSAAITTDSPELQSIYPRAETAGSQESSVLEDGGVYHTGDHMIDGDESTSWQEASEGDGTGEWIRVDLDRTYAVRYLTFKLGNWRSQQLFYANNRPAQLLLKLDEQEFYLDFPDGMTPYTVELSEECQASSIFIQVLSVYGGESWSDCCISEMAVFGR